MSAWPGVSASDAAADPAATAAYQVPADARCAASLLLLRDSAHGLEVLMLRRAERDGDLRSGAAVFPGGVLDARDREAHPWCDGLDDAQLSASLGLPAGGLDYAVAAWRETFEEVGLLLAQSLPPASEREAWRLRLASGETSMAACCEALGLRLDLRDWVYFSHWLTPPGLPKRFDTRFFAARAPQDDQVAEPDRGEALEVMWLRPQDALEPAAGLKLLPVTRRTLQSLAGCADVTAALAMARSQGPVGLTLPRVALTAAGACRDTAAASAPRLGAGTRVVLPDEPAYAEVARLDPEGRHTACCELVAGRPVRLSARVLRLTAPNPGMMTGPGTNSYLVGSGGAWCLIDPGPDMPEHGAALLALLEAVGGRLQCILVTHTHRDHSPAAAALAAATGAPVWGRRARHAQGQDPGFRPDHEPDHGTCLALGPDATLWVWHTPGHASNHLCFWLPQERMLFTGDHVMQGSTVVINPPDGDMAAYLASLRALQAQPLQWLAPGHGFLVAQPQRVLQDLIDHRLRRESRVLAALQACAAPATLAELVRPVYADTPVALHGLAQRSLLAHLIKLQGEGRALALEDGSRWSALGA